MARNLLVIVAVVVGISLFLGMMIEPELPIAPPTSTTGQDQNAFQKFIANTARYYVAALTTKKQGEDVLALLDQGELQKLDQSGRLQALLQGERGGVLLVMSAFTSEEARGLAGPLLGKGAKSVSLQIRPAIVTKSFTEPSGRKPVLKASMESFEAAYSVKGKTWVSEGNATSRKILPEHVALVGSLFDKGYIKMYLSFEDSENPRGFFVFSGKSREDIRKMMMKDPIVTEKWIVFDFISCKAPEGTFK